jgi:hypothetical protein
MPPLAYFGIESTGVTLVVDLLILFALLLYVALVYWTYVDSRRRIEDSMLTGFATAASLIPFLGTLLYLIVRPTETLEDARERELEFETTKLRLHQLESSLCPHCDYPIEAEYVRCPSCLRKLKDRCTSCSRPLDRAWTICPFCETEVPSTRAPSRRTGKRSSRQRSEIPREGSRPPERGAERPVARDAQQARAIDGQRPSQRDTRREGQRADGKPARPPAPPAPERVPAPARPASGQRPASASGSGSGI